mgnify:CR=1 FL=1
MSTIDRVLQLAKEKGVSQAFICGKLGVRRTYLSEVRVGKDNLADDRLSIIADLLNTTPEYLKGETETKEKGSATENGDRSLTKEEWDVISAYRAASEEIKDAVKRIVKP